MKLQDKVAVITGSGSGFGEAMAKRFAVEGARVVVADVNDDGGERVVSEIGEAARFVHTDVRKGAEVATMIQSALDAFGRLDILVNNAGYRHQIGTVDSVSEEEFDRCFDVNVKSIYHGVVSVLPVFRAQGEGVILNIASTGGTRPKPSITWYNASKGAAVIATKSLARELAPEGIRVCAINPSAALTGMLYMHAGEETPERTDWLRDSVPLGRLNEPEYVASAALFLVSDEASFVTGVCLDVDGGQSA
jgi:3-oxoacyl-[acyl-carrier protein] reductase